MNRFFMALPVNSLWLEPAMHVIYVSLMRNSLIINKTFIKIKSYGLQYSQKKYQTHTAPASLDEAQNCRKQEGCGS